MPTRFPGGITNVTPNTALENLQYPNPFTYGDIILKNPLWNDVVTTSPVSYIATTVGTGTRAIGNTTGTYGTAVFTNSAANDDSIFVQSRGKAAIATASNKRILFSCSVAPSSIVTDLIFGITNTTTTPIGEAGTEETGTTDGIYFLRVTTEATWRFYVRSGNATVASATGLGSASSARHILSFEYVPTTKKVKVWVDNVQVATVDASTFPATDQYLQMGIQNGDGTARNMSLEYVYVAQER